MDKEPKKTGITRRFASKGIFPHQMAFTLLIPFRNIFLSPKQIVERLEWPGRHHLSFTGCTATKEIIPSTSKRTPKILV